MNPDEVQRWLDDYVAAWKSYEREDIEALFAPKAEYRYRPYEDPIVGRDAIVQSWLDDPDEADITFEAEYRPLVTDGNRAIVTGETRYSNGDVYSNIWELEFDPERRCAKFVEWFMKHP